MAVDTRIVAVGRRGDGGDDDQPLGRFGDARGLARLNEWRVSPAAVRLPALEAASRLLRTSDAPVAFPTETVYGLGADATRRAAVRAIFAAKGRPADNPLIVHVCDLDMLRRLLGPGADLPPRYAPLVARFWPGPLTILLPLLRPSPLAPEVTAGLASFGVRMPSLPLALTLIQLAGAPLAAPSANASTKPSPTTARHVRDDLDGRIRLILDGGPCRVGVESTVVDGLCDPPVVLRPGGVAIDELRACPGWESVVSAYEDRSQDTAAAPRTPGMKYKHYSPRATVILYEASSCRAAAGPPQSDVFAGRDPFRAASRTIGLIRTRRWKPGAGLAFDTLRPAPAWREPGAGTDVGLSETPYQVLVGSIDDESGTQVGHVYDVGLGSDTKSIAQGLFSALRELDHRGADTIFVDGIEGELDMAAAVMNRLRKAASEIRA